MAASKGIETTEFVLTCVVNVASLVGSLSGIIPATTAIYVIAAINAVYGILRTIVKVNDPSAKIPELPSIPPDANGSNGAMFPPKGA